MYKINIKFGMYSVQSLFVPHPISYIKVTKMHPHKESILALFSLISNRKISIRQTDFFRKIHPDYSVKLDDLTTSTRFLLSIGTPMEEVIEIMESFVIEINK